MARARNRRRWWRSAPDRVAPAGPTAAPQSPATAEGIRAELLAQAPAVAVLRATAGFLRASLPAEPDVTWAPVLAQIAQLQEELDAFERRWAMCKAPLDLPALPALSAAEESELRRRLQAVVQNALD
jgi:hypothetical protein